MDYIKTHVKEKEKKIEIIVSLNHVRLYKKIILPCELVAIEGNKKTRELRNPLESSYFIWKIKFPILPKLYNKLL